MEQLLFLELLLKLAGGLVLLLVPLSACRVLGLPRPEHGIWPRLLGVVLVGMAGALYIEGAIKNGQGLGLAGLVVINLSAALALFAIIALNGAGQSQRGPFALAVTSFLLILLSLIEIAYI